MRTNHLATATGLFSTALLLAASCATPGENVGQTGSGVFNIEQHPTAFLCPTDVRPGYARCHAKVRTDIMGTMTPQGFGPSDLVSAYKLPSSGGSGQTIALVDANDDPNAESDLAAYRSQYGLPPCTSASGCFKKVNQDGVEGSYPAPDSGWAGEISLDLDMVSAGCPSCKIILVEVNSATTANLGAGVNTAASLGANAISNSYGGPEDGTVESASTTYYNHPGILVVASNGDSGYGANFPASSQYVLAVGGTSLVKDGSSRGWAETVWNGTGAGCSSVIPKPSWQTDPDCNYRTVGDVSAIADPNTGVSVYNTYAGAGGWNVYGGTSVAAPLVTAIFALTGKTSTSPQFPYSNQSAFYDVTTGSDGSCGGSYLCTGVTGYDGPTGYGTPNGTSISGGMGTGGSAGSGGTGGSGSSGGGGADAGAGDGGSYAFVRSHDADRHHSVELSPGASETIPFTWHDAAGLAPTADLWVEVDGRPVLQVSSVGSSPFARAGLEVVTLEAGTSYRIVLVRNDGTVSVSILRDTNEVVLGARAEVFEASTADVVLPSTSWRKSISSDLL
jgi:subtilase family serine protease